MGKSETVELNDAMVASTSQSDNNQSKGGGGVAERSQWFVSPRLALLALILAPLVLYLPAIGGEFLWDDFDYISQSRTIRSPDGLWNIFFNPRSLPFPYGTQYYPLVYGSFWLEYRVWKLNPEGYHLANVLLHGLSAVLIYWLLQQLRVRGAWLCAVLFAIHPVHVESVAWIVERKNTLSLFLALLALRCYLPLAGLGDRSPPPLSRARTTARYLGALLLFGASLLAKTVTCTLPAVILVLQYWKRGTLRWKDFGVMLPFFAIGLLAGLPTITAEQHYVGASGSDFDIPLLNRFLLAGSAIWFYAERLLAPWPLSFFYHRWTLDSHSTVQWTLLVAALVTPLALFLARKQISRGPLAAVLIFGGVLFPALGFVNVFPMKFSWVADHFQYHASVSLIALMGAGTSIAMHRLETTTQRKSGTLLVPLCTIWLAILGTLTWQRAHLFSSQELLWRDTLRHAPHAWIVHQNLAVLLSGKGNLDEAETHARRSLELHPDNPAVYHNLGSMAQARGNLSEAESHYRKAIELQHDLGPALVNLGAVLLVQNRPGEAVTSFLQATQVLPREPKAWLGLSEAHRQLGKTELADRLRIKADRLAISP
ncbi:MAG: tetratricopeptide repeat protein [Candidatus Sumerlaeaceae bacterium]